MDKNNVLTHFYILRKNYPRRLRQENLKQKLAFGIIQLVQPNICAKRLIPDTIAPLCLGVFVVLVLYYTYENQTRFSTQVKDPPHNPQNV